MMSARSVVLIAPVRTPIGTFGGSLKEMPAPDLGAIAIKTVVARAGLHPEEVGTAVMGNVVQAGAKMNPARQAAIHAGLPVSVPAMTVNRVCGSGAQAIVSAAQEILLGGVEAAVAGGMENMDLAPYLIARGRWGYRMGDGQLYDSMLRDGLDDAFSDQASGWPTEDLVRELQVGRDAQDRWALRSQQRFAAAQAAGRFEDEIVAVEIAGRKGPTFFAKDEHNRPGTTLDALAALNPAFRPDGTITAGNAPGLNSGAAAVVLADEDWAQNRGLAPATRLISYGIAAVEPGMFGLGPIPAVRQALDRAGWRLGNIERPFVRRRRDRARVRGTGSLQRCKPAFDRFDHSHHGYPHLPAIGSTGQIDRGRASACLGERSSDSRLHWDRREPVGLYQSDDDTGLRTVPRDGR
jgi:acetyl-CoA C-acetyltransferase